MRSVAPDDPAHPSNQGTVVFHAGGNIAGWWEDFRLFSEADQDYFEGLLPLEELVFDDATEFEYIPRVPRRGDEMKVHAQSDVFLEEIPLLQRSEEARQAFEFLIAQGFSADEEKLKPIQVPRQRRRQATRNALDELVKNAAGRVLNERGVSHAARMKDNFVYVKSTLDRHLNQSVGHGQGERADFSLDELVEIIERFPSLVEAYEKEPFDGTP